jgi:proteasome lid subunit RPN8/RPN11
MKLTKRVQNLIKQHAADNSDEICGFVIQGTRSQSYFPCTNVSSVPAESFTIPAEDWIAAEKLGEVQAIVHSHPNSEPYLSGADRVAQHQSLLPWVLITGGEIKTFRYAPLLRGRVFEYGKHDCFTLIRDAFMLAGIEFRDHQRIDIDYDAEIHSFETNLPDGGFSKVQDLQVGDVILTAYSNIPAHVMMYIGHGEVIHHKLDRLSSKELYTEALRRRTDSIWRHQDWKPEMITAIKNDLENNIRGLSD